MLAPEIEGSDLELESLRQYNIAVTPNGAAPNGKRARNASNTTVRWRFFV